MKFRKTIAVLLSLILCYCTLLVYSPTVSAAKSIIYVNVDKEKIDYDLPIMVSLGDSYSSGEGNEHFYDYDKPFTERVNSSAWLAHRSEKSWPGRLVLTANDGTKMKMSEYRGKNWVFAASSGAVTWNLYDDHEQEKTASQINSLTGNALVDFDIKTQNLAPQLEVFKSLKEESVDYVTMTMGGNDAGFTDVIISALVLRNRYFDPNCFSAFLQTKVNSFNKADGIRSHLETAYNRIAKSAGSQAHIIIAGYPNLLESTGKTKIFSEYEAKEIGKAVTFFNSGISNLVDTLFNRGMRIHFVSVMDDTKEYNFCGHEAYSEEPYINKLMLRQNEDIDQLNPVSAYSMHPNEKGLEVYAHCVQEKIEWLEAGNGEPPKSPSRAKPTEKPTDKPVEIPTHKPSSDANQSLQTKLNDLISEYGIASNETYTANTNVINDKSWTHREGIVSAKLSDLDSDGINELVVVRLLGGELNPYSESLEVSVYYYYSDDVKSAGKVKLPYGSDFTEKKLDLFLYTIGTQKNLFYECDNSLYGTDGLKMSYYVLEYQNGKLNKKIFIESTFDYGLHQWTETKWDGDNEETVDIYKNVYDPNTQKSTITGSYKKSSNPILDYFMDLGLPNSNESFVSEDYVKFFNVNGSEKLCEISLIRNSSNMYQYISSLKDYTDLDHSKATTSADKAAEWKELYISYLNSASDINIYNHADLIYLNDDEIPELVLLSGSFMPGGRICWIKDGEVKTYDSGACDGMNYSSRTGLISSGALRQGNEYYTVFYFNGYKVEVADRFSIFPDFQNESNTKYFVNNEEVSKSVYDSKRSKYSIDQEISYETSIQDMKTIIKNY